MSNISSNPAFKGDDRGRPSPPRDSDSSEGPTLFGHPTGLFTLFFAEMWERFSYYGMRAILVFYMTKGFLGYGDTQAYGVYGAYTSLVYMTPFFGGLIADRLLGPRIAVIIGGILMSLGHLLMGVEGAVPFYSALGLLIAGNGFFKPNISTMVGSLYPKNSPKRDGGYTIFYMGINLGAVMSPLLCGYVGETYGWHYGFGLATIGMMAGLAVFVMPNFVSQVLIGGGAVAAALGLFVFHSDNFYATIINLCVAAAVMLGGTAAVTALARGGLPAAVGAPPAGVAVPRALGLVLLGTAILIPLFVLLVSGFSFFNDGKPVTLIPDAVIESLGNDGLGAVAAIFLSEISKPAGLVLSITGILAFGYLIIETFRLEKISRDRMLVVLILTFFSMLFWAFFEQAGSSINNFTDRNVDRVTESRLVTSDEVGTTITIEPTQEQLGYLNGTEMFTLDSLDSLRKANEKDPTFTIPWRVVESNVGMGIAQRSSEIPASTFQAVNPGAILIFGMIFSLLWTELGKRRIEPSTPLKFAAGLLQLGLGFLVFWYGCQTANDRGMATISWLVLGYLLHTTGELCLSPVGLSMISKLSPKYLVSTVMGGWFLATAFSQYLAGIISIFTGVSHGGDGGKTIPPPVDSIDVYGGVFYNIGIAAIVSGFICVLMTPRLKSWMHNDLVEAEEA